MAERCSHGGCQTPAVVQVVRAENYPYENWCEVGERRPACRNHMATIVDALVDPDDPAVLVFPAQQTP